MRCNCAILFFLVASGSDMADAIMNTATVVVCRRPACKNGIEIGEEPVRKEERRGRKGHETVRRVDIFIVLW